MGKFDKNKTCLYCSEEMEAKNRNKKFCSDKCRVYYNRENPKKEKTTSQVIVEAHKNMGQEVEFVKSGSFKDFVDSQTDTPKTTELTSFQRLQKERLEGKAKKQ